MLNTTNTKFLFVELWFTNQNWEEIEIENNVNMTLIMRYSTEPKYRKYVKRY